MVSCFIANAAYFQACTSSIAPTQHSSTNDFYTWIAIADCSPYNIGNYFESSSNSSDPSTCTGSPLQECVLKTSSVAAGEQCDSSTVSDSSWYPDQNYDGASDWRWIQNHTIQGSAVNCFQCNYSYLSNIVTYHQFNVCTDASSSQIVQNTTNVTSTTRLLQGLEPTTDEGISCHTSNVFSANETGSDITGIGVNNWALATFFQVDATNDSIHVFDFTSQSYPLRSIWWRGWKFGNLFDSENVNYIKASFQIKFIDIIPTSDAVLEIQGVSFDFSSEIANLDTWYLIERYAAFTTSNSKRFVKIDFTGILKSERFQAQVTDIKLEGFTNAPCNTPNENVDCTLDNVTVWENNTVAVTQAYSLAFDMQVNWVQAKANITTGVISNDQAFTDTDGTITIDLANYYEQGGVGSLDLSTTGQCKICEATDTSCSSSSYSTSDGFCICYTRRVNSTQLYKNIQVCTEDTDPITNITTETCVTQRVTNGWNNVTYWTSSTDYNSGPCTSSSGSNCSTMGTQITLGGDTDENQRTITYSNNHNFNENMKLKCEFTNYGVTLESQPFQISIKNDAPGPKSSTGITKNKDVYGTFTINLAQYFEQVGFSKFNLDWRTDAAVVTGATDLTFTPEIITDASRTTRTLTFSNSIIESGTYLTINFTSALYGQVISNTFDIKISVCQTDISTLSESNAPSITAEHETSSESFNLATYNGQVLSYALSTSHCNWGIYLQDGDSALLQITRSVSDSSQMTGSVKPASSLNHRLFTFRVRITKGTCGGTVCNYYYPSSTTFYEMTVGCVNGYVTFIDNMVDSYLDLKITNFTNVIIAPTPSLTWCPSIKNTITHVTINDTAVTGNNDQFFYTPHQKTKVLYKDRSTCNLGNNNCEYFRTDQFLGPTNITMTINFWTDGGLTNTYIHNYTINCTKDTSALIIPTSSQLINSRNHLGYWEGKTLVDAVGDSEFEDYIDLYYIDPFSCEITESCCHNFTYQAMSLDGTYELGTQYIIAVYYNNDTKKLDILFNVTSPNTKMNFTIKGTDIWGNSATTTNQFYMEVVDNCFIHVPEIIDFENTRPLTYYFDSVNKEQAYDTWLAQTAQRYSRRKNSGVLTVKIKANRFDNPNDQNTVDFITNLAGIFKSSTKKDCVTTYYKYESWDENGVIGPNYASGYFTFNTSTANFTIYNIKKAFTANIMIDACNYLNCTRNIELKIPVVKLIIIAEQFEVPRAPFFLNAILKVNITLVIVQEKVTGFHICTSQKHEGGNIVCKDNNIEQWKYDYQVRSTTTAAANLSTTISTGKQQWMKENSDRDYITFELEKFQNLKVNETYTIVVQCIDLETGVAPGRILVLIDVMYPFDFAAWLASQNGYKDTQEVEVDNRPEFKIGFASMDEFGNMDITFNDVIKDKGLTKKDMNFSLAAADYESRELSKMKFDYTFVKFEKYVLKVKLDFHHPIFISTENQLDQLKIHVHNRSKICSNTTDKPLDTLFYSLEIPRQRPDNDAINRIKEFAAAAQNVMKYIFLVALGFNLLLSQFEGGLDIMLLMMRSLQIVMHLPLQLIKFPLNVLIIIQIAVPVVMFDILDNDYGFGIQAILPFADDKVRIKKGFEVTEPMDTLGYQSFNALLNLGTMSILFLLYFMKIPILALIGVINSCCVKRFRCKRTYNYLLKSMFFGELLSYLIEGNLEFLVAMYFNIQSPLYDPSGEIVSNIMVLVLIPLLLVILPALSIWVICKDKDALMEKDFKRKYQVLYNQANHRSGYSKSFILVFLIRRLTFVATCFFMKKVVIYQLFVILGSNLTFTMYQAGTAPLKTRFDNNLELFNQAMVTFSSFHLFLFTDYILDIERKFEIGWSMIGFLGVIVVVNMGFILSYVFNLIKLVVYYYYKLFTYDPYNNPRQKLVKTEKDIKEGQRRKAVILQNKIRNLMNEDDYDKNIVTQLKEELKEQQKSFIDHESVLNPITERSEEQQESIKEQKELQDLDDKNDSSSSLDAPEPFNKEVPLENIFNVNNLPSALELKRLQEEADAEQQRLFQVAVEQKRQKERQKQQQINILKLSKKVKREENMGNKQLRELNNFIVENVLNKEQQ